MNLTTVVVATCIEFMSYDLFLFNLRDIFMSFQFTDIADMGTIVWRVYFLGCLILNIYSLWFTWIVLFPMFNHFRNLPVCLFKSFCINALYRRRLKLKYFKMPFGTTFSVMLNKTKLWLYHDIVYIIYIWILCFLIKSGQVCPYF